MKKAWLLTPLFLMTTATALADYPCDNVYITIDTDTDGYSYNTSLNQMNGTWDNQNGQITLTNPTKVSEGDLLSAGLAVADSSMGVGKGHPQQKAEAAAFGSAASLGKVTGSISITDSNSNQTYADAVTFELSVNGGDTQSFSSCYIHIANITNNMPNNVGLNLSCQFNSGKFNAGSNMGSIVISTSPSAGCNPLKR